jgi:hypothetical protein
VIPSLLDWLEERPPASLAIVVVAIVVAAYIVVGIRRFKEPERQTYRECRVCGMTTEEASEPMPPPRAVVITLEELLEEPLRCKTCRVLLGLSYGPGPEFCAAHEPSRIDNSGRTE